MSKYKVGDKVVLTVTSTNEMGCLPCYVLNDDLILSKQEIDKYAEPLSTYTEPLEAKIRRQAAEITRLLTENERLKPNYENIRAKGQNEAWELAKKILEGVPNGGYSPKELAQIFGCEISKPCIVENTYSEAAAKVAEWEKTKEEIKAGDILEDIYNSNVKCIVTNLYPNNKAYLVFDDGTAGMHELNNFKKTGRHIDIDSFLRQIGGE